MPPWTISGAAWPSINFILRTPSGVRNQGNANHEARSPAMNTPSDVVGNWNRCDAEPVLKLLQGFYAVMGNPPAIEGAMVLMAEALAERASLDAIRQALDRCLTETYPVRLPHILAKLPGVVAEED